MLQNKDVCLIYIMSRNNRFAVSFQTKILVDSFVLQLKENTLNGRNDFLKSTQFTIDGVLYYKCNLKFDGFLYNESNL